MVREELRDITEKAKLHLSVGRLDAAEKLLRSSIAEHGDAAHLVNLLGVTYLKQDRIPDAVEQFRRAIRINPQFVEAGLNLSALYCDLSCYDDAREIFSRAVGQLDAKRRQPNLVMGRLANQHVALGQSYEHSGMPLEAIAEYRKGLSLYDDMPDVKLRLGKLLFRTGQREKATTEFESLVANHSSFADAHSWLGVCYFKAAQHTAAKLHWSKAQEIDPNHRVSAAYLRALEITHPI